MTERQWVLGPCARRFVLARLSYRSPDILKQTRRGDAVNDFQFGPNPVRTLVSMIAPIETETIAVDVMDYMWEIGDAD